MAKYRVPFANVVKGGEKNGKKYGDFVSVFKDMELKKDSIINLQTPEERLEELKGNYEFQTDKGWDTTITEKQIESMEKTVASKKVRFVLSVFQEKS